MAIRVLIASDIHLEFEAGRIFRFSDAWEELRDARLAAPGHPEIGPLLSEFCGSVDLGIFCGDIHLGDKAIPYLQRVSEFLEVPVCYICGNHEYYNQLSVSDVHQSLIAATADLPNVHFLENDRADFVIDGQRIAVLGATAWTDMKGFATAQHLVDQQMYQVRDQLSDYQDIFVAAAYQPRQMTPQDTVEWHRETVSWLSEAIPAARATSDKVVVMTHHAPSLRCVVNTDRAHLDFAYASSLDELVIQTDLWAHGHIHDAEPIRIGGVPGTPVVASCRGYVSRAWGWDYKPLVVEI